ncbi:MAG: hypothetical protein WCF51_06165 [Nitrosomonadaceae bacterium]
MPTLAKVHFRSNLILIHDQTDVIDHSPLDTLVLAMPVSWKGALQQYAF